MHHVYARHSHHVYASHSHHVYAITTTCYTHTDCENFENVSAKEIVNAPKEVAINCIHYWLDNLPDMSDKPTFNPKHLATLGRVKKDRRKSHCHLSGLVGRWVNITIDWAIYLGLWAVKFTDEAGVKTELVSMFSTAVWIRYVSLMCGKPTFRSNAAQKVFRYL